MERSNRREFLSQVGQMVLVASVGTGAACELGIAPAAADEGTERLAFDRLEPLACLLQETPVSRLLPELVARVRSGTGLADLVAAAALANARTFGGEHYRGFHTFMALAPAYRMAKELPAARRPLPVLKVLYRNTDLMQEAGGRARETLRPVKPAELPHRTQGAELLRAANRRGDMERSEAIFAALIQGTPESAFNDLLLRVEDRGDVHTTVLVWRAWEMLDLTGRRFAHALLRQSVRHCITEAAGISCPDRIGPLLEKYRLLDGALGNRRAEDAFVEQLGLTLLGSPPAQAAEAVAAALRDGYAPEEVGEAISLAANQLVLRQVAFWEKGLGARVHGDSPGVHASDATNAWRNIVRVANPRHQAAGLLVAAANVAESLHWSEDPRYRGHGRQPWPLPEHLETVAGVPAAMLLSKLDDAIRARDQARACALVHRYGVLALPPRPVFDLLLKYAISEDGRLHAEKYYRTVAEEFATTRPAFRWRQLAALARVTASEFGFSEADTPGNHRAAGYEEACVLLGVGADRR